MARHGGKSHASRTIYRANIGLRNGSGKRDRICPASAKNEKKEEPTNIIATGCQLSCKSLSLSFLN